MARIKQQIVSTVEVDKAYLKKKGLTIEEFMEGVVSDVNSELSGMDGLEVTDIESIDQD